MTTLGPPADEKSPDHSICRFCGVPISWDEICYIHDDTGFSDCGVTVGGSTAGSVIINPSLSVDPAWQGRRAEPITWEGEGG